MQDNTAASRSRDQQESTAFLWPWPRRLVEPSLRPTQRRRRHRNSMSPHGATRPQFALTPIRFP